MATSKSRKSVSAKSPRRSFSPDYRKDAAHLVIDTGRPIAVVAREIGVGEQLLGRWVAIERSRLDEPPEGLPRVSLTHGV